MIAARNPRSLLYTSQSTLARSFHELFWRWSSLEKTSKKYHTRSFRQNAFSKCIHQHSRKNSSLSDPSPSLPTGAIEPTNIPKDTPADSQPRPPELENLALELRQVMRHVVHSVVVLTTPHRTTASGGSIQAAAMTLSSFTTLTLSPEPIVTFNIKRPSRTLDALKAIVHPDTLPTKHPKDNYFHIHILECSTPAAQIATHFSRGGPISSEDLALIYPKTRTADHTSRGIKRTLECEILQDGNGGFIDVGDHTLVFGKVINIGRDQANPHRKKHPWGGLCYMHGDYRIAAPMMSLRAKKDAIVQEDKVGDKKALSVEKDGELAEDSILISEEKNPES
ncbi:082cc859-216f-45ff-a187-a13dc18ec370 [Sclerotinia trifoliorum]|uniref:082cc859-216f-45ff-a187-a13dc18ec370 n=1 Tax=Sclerotinia trifoliorum TaxID=28548 RepID=A0A8H2VQ65_9HELO|nr:082cc859-216f-45ff-a187-a13dc18ec370 [Sclerotinia trifoliorum]